MRLINPSGRTKIIGYSRVLFLEARYKVDSTQQESCARVDVQLREQERCVGYAPFHSDPHLYCGLHNDIDWCKD